MKKTFAMRLREKTENMEYTAVCKKLLAIAGNKNTKQELLVIQLQPDTIIRLQNEGLNIEEISEFGYSKLRLTWHLTKEQKLINQIKWPVNLIEKYISVPHTELIEAENNSIVSELRSLHFHIQLAIA